MGYNKVPLRSGSDYSGTNMRTRARSTAPTQPQKRPPTQHQKHHRECQPPASPLRIIRMIRCFSNGAGSSSSSLVKSDRRLQRNSPFEDNNLRYVFFLFFHTSFPGVPSNHISMTLASGPPFLCRTIVPTSMVSFHPMLAIWDATTGRAKRS